MLIARKLHSLVLIETVNFARVRTFYRRHQSGIADGDAKAGGQSPASPWRWSRPMPGPHTRLQMINRHSGWWCARNVAKQRWLPEMSQNGRGRRHRGSATREVQQLIGPQTTGWEIAASPTPMLDVAGQSVDIACRCDREMASSSQVSGAVAHVSKRRLRMWRNRPPLPPVWEMYRPAIRCSWYLSDLSCFL